MKTFKQLLKEVAFTDSSAWRESMIINDIMNGKLHTADDVYPEAFDTNKFIVHKYKDKILNHINGLIRRGEHSDTDLFHAAKYEYFDDIKPALIDRLSGLISRHQHSPEDIEHARTWGYGKDVPGFNNVSKREEPKDIDPEKEKDALDHMVAVLALRGPKVDDYLHDAEKEGYSNEVDKYSLYFD